MVDFWLVPDVALNSTLFRIAATFVLFGFHALLRWHNWGERYPEALMCCIVLIPQIHYAWLMPQTGPAFAYYFAGYAVMIYGYAALIPGRVIWIVIANLISVIAVTLSLILSGVSAVSFDFNAIYVFYAAMIFAGILSGFNSWRLHLSQYQARQALIEEKDLTEDLLVKLEHVSRRDPLTNLANRRYWEEMLGLYWRENKDMCLAIIDIDHFKGINDLFGHKAGDEVLIKFAQILEDRVADQGFFARLGGDEFAVLLLGDDTEVHSQVFLGIMADAKAIRLIDSPKARVTLSVGVALRESRDATSSELMQRADRQLYVAKISRDAISVDLPETSNKQVEQASGESALN